MHFDFSEDQRLLQRTVRDFLEGEVPPDRVRRLWASETGRSRELWHALAGVGVTGVLVPEAQGGLGLDETDAVLLLEEIGRAALPEPVIATAVVAPRLLAEASEPLAAEWLPKIASGEAVVAVGHSVSDFVADAHVADLLLLPGEDAVHAVPPDQVALRAEPANDPGERLFTLRWSPTEETRIAEGRFASHLRAEAFDRGAFATAAVALGVCDRLIERAVEHACQREQFGVPIGSFQAVKHMLAEVRVDLEYARSLVYRAAHSVAHGVHARAADVSMAKVAACEATLRAARVALQVHGAIGYTWEHDLHLWMRRAWSLDLSFGETAWHRGRMTDAVIDESHPCEAFGYRHRAAAA